MGGAMKKAGRKRQGSSGGRIQSAAPKRAIVQIQSALSLDLLSSQYRDYSRKRLSHVCRGHCYVAAEALYHLFGSKAGFVPYVYKHPNGVTHWWLAHPESGDVLDPTAPQLKGSKRAIYSSGRRHAFRTAAPSKRAQELMRRITAAKKS